VTSESTVLGNELHAVLDGGSENQPIRGIAEEG
jgi:hypothetical protein